MDVASETMELFRRHAAREQRNAAAAATAAEPAGQSSSSPQQQQQQDASSIQQASPVKQQQQQQGGSSGVDVTVTVLTQAHWPTQARLALNLPSVSGAWPFVDAWMGWCST
jgi:hypothetical protein